ncbi:MAG: PAS domain S-box protein [Methanoregula sp.]|jgi:PAS domain S-box-containing protein
MVPGKVKPKDKGPDVPRFGYSLRDYAEEQLARSKKSSSVPAGQTPEQIIHELQVHQIELEMQAEELRRAHLELEESRDKYLDLYDFAPVGYLTLSDKALVEEVNLTGALLLGIVRRKLIHARFRKIIHPKDLDLWDRHFLSVLKTGEKESFDLELVHSNGSLFPVRLDCIRIQGNEANPAVRIAISDITRQKEAEAAIRESEERFWRLFSEVPLPYQSLDAEGRLLEVSPQWLETLGYTREEVIGRWFGDFLAPESRESVREVLKKYMVTGAISNEEFRVRKKDGSELLALYTGRVAHNPDGSFRQTYCIFEDITERKRAEDALRISNKKLNLLSSITRHDINNQLLIVNGFLGMLQSDIRNPAFDPMFTKISDASNRIATMIAFTREYEQVGVNAPAWQDCRAIIDTAAQQVPPGQVMVKNDFPRGTEVFADPLFARVCTNLIDNAIRHGGKITAIRFSAEERDGSHVMVCEDNGDGIPAGEKERIFDRGFGKNTGLGLTLAREILDITGITIKECGEPGKGVRFEIAVPKGMWRSPDRP